MGFDARGAAIWILIVPSDVVGVRETADLGQGIEEWLPLGVWGAADLLELRLGGEAIEIEVP
jgi:hypothetical protein